MNSSPILPIINFEVHPFDFSSESVPVSVNSEKFLLVFLSKYSQTFSIPDVSALIEELKLLNTISFDSIHIQNLQELTQLSTESLEDIFKVASRL